LVVLSYRLDGLSTATQTRGRGYFPHRGIYAHECPGYFFWADEVGNNWTVGEDGVRTKQVNIFATSKVNYKFVFKYEIGNEITHSVHIF